MKRLFLLLAIALPLFGVQSNVDTLQSHALRVTRPVGGVPGKARFDSQGWMWTPACDTADTAIKAQHAIQSDTSRAAHVADTSLRTDNRYLPIHGTADTAIKSQRSVFADSSTNTHKADTAIDAGKFAGHSWPVDTVRAAHQSDTSLRTDNRYNAKYSGLDSGAVTIGALPVGVTNTHTLTSSNAYDTNHVFSVTLDTVKVPAIKTDSIKARVGVIDTLQVDSLNSHGTLMTKTGRLRINTIPAAGVKHDSILVGNADTVSYRSAAQILGDIGAVGGAGTQYYVPLWGSGGATLGNSIAYQDAGATKLTVAGSLEAGALVSGLAASAFRFSSTTDQQSFFIYGTGHPSNALGLFATDGLGVAIYNSDASSSYYNLNIISGASNIKIGSGGYSTLCSKPDGSFFVGGPVTFGGAAPYGSHTFSTIATFGVGTYTFDLSTAQLVSDLATIRFGAYNGPANNSGTTPGAGVCWIPNYTGYTKRSAGIYGIGEGNYFRMGLGFYVNGTSDASTDWSLAMHLNDAGQLLLPLYYTTAGVLHSSSVGLISSSLILDADVSGSAAIAWGKIASGGGLDSGAGTANYITRYSDTHKLTNSNMSEASNVLTATDSLYLNGYGFKSTKSITGDTIYSRASATTLANIIGNSAVHSWTTSAGSYYHYSLEFVSGAAGANPILFDTSGIISTYDIHADTARTKMVFITNNFSGSNLCQIININTNYGSLITFPGGSVGDYGSGYSSFSGSNGNINPASMTGLIGASAGLFLSTYAGGNIYITPYATTTPAVTVRSDSIVIKNPITSQGTSLNFSCGTSGIINFSYNTTSLMSLGYGGTGIQFLQLAPASGVSLFTINTTGLLAAMPHDSLYLARGIRTATTFIGESLATTGGATFGAPVCVQKGSTYTPALTTLGLFHTDFAVTNPAMIVLSGNQAAATPTYPACIQMWGQGYTGGTTQACEIGVVTSQGNTSTNINGSIVFKVSNNATSPSEIVRFTSAGVGILNTAPGNTLTLGTAGAGTASFGIADVQVHALLGDENFTPTCSRVELTGTHNAALLAGSLPNGTLLIISLGSAGGYPTVTFNGHNYGIDANHSFQFFKNSSGTWYPLTPYTS